MSNRFRHILGRYKIFLNKCGNRFGQRKRPRNFGQIAPGGEDNLQCKARSKIAVEIWDWWAVLYWR